MARKKTIASAIKASVKSQLGWAKFYREYARKIGEFGKELPKDLPFEHLSIDNYVLSYSPNTTEDSATIRATVGRVLGISKWDKRVNQYSGNVTYNGKAKLPSGRDIEVNIDKGELSPGCKIIQVEEVRKVFKSVCPDAQGNTQLELTS